MPGRAFHEGATRPSCAAPPGVLACGAVPPCLVLLRHGATEWSRNGRHTGRIDLPLLEEGRAQARAAGDFLRAQGFVFAAVRTSPLQRAAETCALAGFRGEPDPDLLEWDYGDYEGRTSADIAAEVPDWTLWTHGVRGGERAGDVGRRVDRVIARARQEVGDTLCVAHGHVLRVLTARWLELPPVAGRLYVLQTAAVSVLGWEHDTPVVRGWNLGVPLGA